MYGGEKTKRKEKRKKGKKRRDIIKFGKII